jgi:hypothetical protein
VTAGRGPHFFEDNVGAINYASKYKGARVRVFELLSDLRWHTWRELEAVGGNRYGARVLELEKLGWNIIDEPHGEDGKRYLLASLTKGPPLPKLVRMYVSEASAQYVARGEVTEEARRAARDGLESFNARKGNL